MDLAKIGPWCVAYHKAKYKNDFSALAQLLREDSGSLHAAGFDDLYILIADKLDGQFKAKRGRKNRAELPQKYKIIQRQVWIITNVQKWSKEAAVAEVARKNSVSQKQVYEWLKKAPKPTHAWESLMMIDADVIRFEKEEFGTQEYLDSILSL